MDAKYFIAVHVVGCLVFNHRLRAKVYLNYPNVHNDSNLTIHVIQDVLNEWEGDLPPVLYLQLDNTSRENKNKFLMAYLHMLVERGVFKKIKVGFLMVGHTHDQIDQMFSRFLVKLNKRRAYRLETLEEILMDSYRPKPEIKFISEVGDFRKYVSDRYENNSEGLGGDVLLPLNNIRAQRQLRIKQIRNDTGETQVQFHAKHLSTTPDWGDHVPLVRFIPATRFWIASQMPLKAASGISNIGGDNDDGDDPETGFRDPNLVSLQKYRRAILHEGYTFYQPNDRLWWSQFFQNQEEILKNRLKEGEWSFEWSWPKAYKEPTEIHAHDGEPVDIELLEKVSGPKKTMYSGRRKAGQSLGDYTDLEVNNKWSMICVKADGDSRGLNFWVAKVANIISCRNNIPDKILVEWYIVDSNASAMEGKYQPEKSQVGKNLQNELSLSETTVYAYNFALLENRKLSTETKRIIKRALLSDNSNE